MMCAASKILVRTRAVLRTQEMVITPPSHQEGGNCLQNFPSVFVMVTTLSLFLLLNFYGQGGTF